MKIYKLLGILAVFMFLVTGCVSNKSSQKKPYSGETNLVDQYIAKGESFEKKDRLPSALEQYKLALTIDSKSRKAARHKKNVLAKLWKKAQSHYKKGLQLDKQGKYDQARKEYLSALMNWPGYKKAKKKLTPGKISEDRVYIIHKLMKGESVSKLGMIYYGDFKKYPIIGKFNQLKDVTKVRVGEKLKIPVIQGVSLLDLKQKQEAYLNAQTRQTTGVEKPEKKTQIATKEVKETNDALQSTGGMSLPKQPSKQEDVQNITIPPENSKVFELEKKDLKEAQNTLKAPLEKPAFKEPAMEKVIEKKLEIKKPLTKKSVTKIEKEVSLPDSYNQAVVLFNKKKYSTAIPLFAAVEKTRPEDKKLLDYLFNSYFQSGLIQFNSKAYLKASDSFKSALKYNENCDNCQSYIDKCMATYKEKHYNLGIQYFSREQLSKAIEEWNLVNKIDPGYKKVAPNLKKAKLLFKRLENIKQSNTQ